MRNITSICRNGFVVLIAVLISISVVQAQARGAGGQAGGRGGQQDAQQQAGRGGQQGGPGPNAKAEEVYKNIKVLTGVPASDITQTMHLIEGETGMDCTFCHVEGAFDKEDKAMKQVARQMITMMKTINSTYFAGQQFVTCYTCHQGHPIPQTVPSMLPVAKPIADPPPVTPKVTLPSADQILTKYVDALGGEQAIRKVTTRVISGTQFIGTGPGGSQPVPASFERVQKAPNLVANTYRTPTFTISDGFDGSKAWTANQQGRVTEPAVLDQGRAKRDADFYLPLDIKQQYTKLEVTGVERVNDRDAYVLVATPQGDLPEKLYFDTLNGLLLRKDTAIPTPAGNSPAQVSYSDYRDTGSGVKFPYTITMSPATSRSVLFTTAVLRVDKVQDNAPVDDAKIGRPAPKPAAQ